MRSTPFRVGSLVNFVYLTFEKIKCLSRRLPVPLAMSREYKVSVPLAPAGYFFPRGEKNRPSACATSLEVSSVVLFRITAYQVIGKPY